MVIWEPKPPGIFWATAGWLWDSFTINFLFFPKFVFPQIFSLTVQSYYWTASPRHNLCCLLEARSANN